MKIAATGAREENGLLAELGSDYGEVRRERTVDQAVANHGVRPLDDLYFALRPGSTSLGEVDCAARIARRPQAVVRNPAGTYALFRIGDAVSSRNTHAAIHDALRLARALRMGRVTGSPAAPAGPSPRPRPHRPGPRRHGRGRKGPAPPAPW